MIERLGYRQMLISTIVLPGDVVKRKKDPHVIELARSIDELGEEPIHAPTVDERTKKLIAGRDRMAAMLLNDKRRKIWVQVVRGSEEELKDWELDENIHRRADDRDALIAQRVKKVAAKIELARAEIAHKSSSKSTTEPAPVGRPKTAAGEAREKVAKELGVTKRAVEQAETRAKEKAEPKAAEAPKPSQPPVETWGVVSLTDAETNELRAVQAIVDAVDKHLRQAQAVLSGLKLASPVAESVRTRLTGHVHTASAEVRRARPHAICPFCKRVPSMLKTCTGCRGLGVVGKEAVENIALELIQKGDGARVIDGKGSTMLVTTALKQAAWAGIAGPVKPEQTKLPAPKPEPAKAS